MARMRDWNNSNGTAFHRNRRDRAIDNSARGTHPGTEQRPVCRRLMLCVVSGVLSRLSLSQSADGEHAKHE